MKMVLTMLKVTLAIIEFPVVIMKVAGAMMKLPVMIIVKILVFVKVML